MLKLAILEDREKDVEDLSVLLTNLSGYEWIAEYFLDKENYERALYYYEKSGVFDKVNAAKYIANVLLDKKDYEKSIYYFKEALDHKMGAYVASLYLIDFYIHCPNKDKEQKLIREIKKLEKLLDAKDVKDALNTEISYKEQLLNIYYAERGDRLYGNGDFLDMYQKTSKLYTSIRKIYRGYYDESVTSLKSDMFQVGKYITLLGGSQGYLDLDDKEASYIIKDSYQGKIADVVEKNGVTYVKVGSRYYYKIESGKFSF